MIGGDDAATELERLRFAIIQTELDPEDPQGHLELGMILLQNGKIEGADDAFARVLEIEPGDANARYFRAIIAQHWGHPEKAARELSSLLKRYPNADAPWAPLRGAIDALIRRAHFYYALLVVLAALFALTGPEDSVRGGVLFLLALALIVAANFWLASALKLGRRMLRSLVRMRIREDTFMRTSVALDVVAGALLVGIVILPIDFWKVLGLLVLGAIGVSSVLHVFTPPNQVDS